MPTDQFTTTYLKAIFGKYLGKDFPAFLASWGDDESLVFNDRGPVGGKDLLSRWTGEKERSSKPHVVSNRGLYVPMKQKTGWMSSRLVMRLLPHSEIVGCKKKVQDVGGGYIVHSLHILDHNENELLLMQSLISETHAELAYLTQALGFRYSDRLGF